MTGSKTPSPGTPAPSPPPPGPTGPTPTGPGPQRFGDDLMTLADAVFETPARPFSTVGHRAQGGPVYSGRDGKGAVERASRPVEPDSEGGRAGDPPVPGAVSESSRAGAGEPLPVLALAEGGRPGGGSAAPGPGFPLPVPVGPPRFELRPPRPGQPEPRPDPNPNPPPAPPPFEVMPCCWCVPGCPVDCHS